MPLLGSIPRCRLRSIEVVDAGLGKLVSLDSSFGRERSRVSIGGNYEV